MKVETEENQSDCAEFQRVPGTDESVCSQPENRRLESKKKLKKMRSIRLLRLPSKRSTTRGGRPQYDNLSILSSVDTESLERPTPIEMADASPNYMKATSSSHAKDSFQNTQRLFTKKRTLTRMSTLKLKRSLTRKLSGRTEPKRKLKSSRSIKLATVKGQKSTRKPSESTYGSDEQNWKSTSDAGNKPQRVITRRLSLKPVRILTKMPTFKSKNSSMERDHQISQSPDTSLHRATCSSALKDSHFPDHIDLPQEGSDSQGVSAAKVCPYSYCSLHGHRHGNLPPQKRFVSMRRRVLKSQKPTKMDHQPVTRSKQNSKARKATQRTQSFHSEDGRSHFQNKKNLARDLCISSPHGTPASTVTVDVESTSTDVVKFSAPDIEILAGEVTITDKNMEPDYEVLQMSSVQKEPTHASTTDMACGVQEKDKKYIKMWQLMYKHAVLSNTGKCENKLSFDGKDKEGGDQDSLAINEVNKSSCHKYCDTDQDTDDENKNAIELVQKAFDEILLPEPEDLFSDDHFKSEGIDSDEVLLEKSEGERERNASPSTESPKAQIMGTKPDQRTPKSWSNLKKLILLKRFVKALEKVRNINRQRPKRFPSDANLEMEKVFLKHQTSEEKKNAEEWMLDYALQKVISKLAPAQRRKVTLLVEAFETILPFQDAENGPRFSATMEPQADPIQSPDDSSNHSKEEASFSHDSTMELADNDGDDPVPELHNPIMLEDRCLEIPRTETFKNMPAFGATEEDLNGKQSLAGSYDNGEKISSDNDNIYHGEIKDTRSSSLNEPVESCHEEASPIEIVNDVPEDLLSNVNTENPHIKSESAGSDVETKNLIGDNEEQFSMSKSLILEGLVRSLRSNLMGSGPPANLLDEPTADRKEGIEKVKLEAETLEEFPTKEQSEAPMSAAGEPQNPVEKQSNTGLWFLVYKHMVSNMAESNSKSLIDGADEKESGFDGNRTRGTSISYESTPVTNQDMQFKDHVVADPEVELQQIEAIKLVEEAIDSILPDDQDELADKESLTGNIISDNSKQSDRTERVYGEGLNQKEEKMESGNGIIQEQQQESAPKEQNKTNQQLSRSWSNLKKVILLRRFIKALEKVRKFNPRGPRYLPVEPDSEAEKINLRHQDMDERKGTEEWMLDYALRQVVSKLTPARKRKVELLVEAFETVIPTIKN
ncbi:calmodulin binding [Spatholobus suberectus]|nr:calmodulin binding [Spatholobus suberectus]